MNQNKLVLCEGYAHNMTCTELERFTRFINEQVNRWFKDENVQRPQMLGEFLKIETRPSLMSLVLAPLINSIEFSSQVSQIQAQKRAEREAEDLEDVPVKKCIECKLTFNSNSVTNGDDCQSK